MMSDPHRRRLLAGLPAAAAALALPAAFAGAQTAPPAGPAPGPAPAAGELSGPARDEAVRALGRAVNAITRLQGRFVQTDPGGRTQTGRFWLHRPGRVRFEYDAPSPLLLVSDGRNVALQDRRLRTTDRYPLRQTPLYFLLKADVDLTRDVVVASVSRNGDVVTARMRDRRREADGELSLRFDLGRGQLEEWSIRDRQGRATRVRLTEARTGGAMDPALFADPGTQRRLNSGG